VRSWWSNPRNRRIALVTAALLAVVWTVAALVATRGSSPSRRKVGTLTVRHAGSTGSPEALWLFGFDTLRLDPARPSTVEQLGTQAFGDVAGTIGGVLLYEPGTGRFGYLDATRNRIVDEVALPGDPARQPIGGTVGGTPRAAWLVTGPGTLLRHSTSAGPDVPVEVAPRPAPGAAVATRLATDAGGAWAVTTTRTADGAVAVVARVTGDPPVVTRTSTVTLSTADVVEVLAAPRGLWLVTRRDAVELDATTLQETRREALAGTDVLAAALTDTTLSYVDAAGELGRIDLATGRDLGRVPRFDLAGGQPFVHLASNDGSLWVLVGTNTNGAFRSELVRFDARARPVFHLGLPGNLAIADLALSRAPASR
jgi:hypothetical protein